MILRLFPYILVAALLNSVSISTAQAATYAYEVVSLGGFAPSSAGKGWASAVNDNQQVVGWSRREGLGAAAYVWKDGVLTDLGSPPGFPSSAVVSAQAEDINERVEIVGFGRQSIGYYRAFRWKNGDFTDLGALPGSDRGSIARAINNRGQIVGESFFGDNAEGFIWDMGSMTKLESLPGESFTRPFDINERGQIVGRSESHAVIWKNGILSELEGVPEDAEVSGARAIINHEQIAGYIYVRAGIYTAVMWNNGVFSSLGNELPSGYFSRWQTISMKAARSSVMQATSQEDALLFGRQATSTILTTK